jgi:glycosyltransferase involved in cell wall biosynthesis
MTGPARGIALVLSGFPRRSETFALTEALALEARGLLAAIFATKPGDGQPPHPDVQRLNTPVQLLHGETAAAQADCLVTCLGQRQIAGLHAYFAHFPAEVAAEAARHLSVPFGFSAHACDVRKVPPEDLARRAREAAVVVVCNEDTAAAFNGVGAAVRHLPHGVDSQRFYPWPFPPGPDEAAGAPVRFLAVGRLVEKKGFLVLLEAVTQLDVPFRLRIIGDGPEYDRLAAAIWATGRAGSIELCGGQTHAELPQAYADAHIVVVPSIVDRNGDRDGLPNVVLEAMASGRPIVASDVGAIRSGVHHGETGFLVPPGDPTALAQAMTWLARRPRHWPALGHHGRAHIAVAYDLRTCTERFCNCLHETFFSPEPLRLVGR